jgi:YVTN family beta-propeller protein
MLRMNVMPALLVSASLILQCTITAQSAPIATLPNGREIHPAGNWIPLAPYPFALAVRPDGGQLAVPSIGFPFALNVIDGPANPQPAVRRMPQGNDNDPAIETHAGLAYSPDSSTLYVATGDSGKIRAYSTADWEPAGELPLDGDETKTRGTFAATLTVSTDGNLLYVLDQGNWRVVVVDAHRLAVLSSAPTGAYPFGLAISPDGKRLYVTNTGLFEYKTIPGADRDRALETGLHFPAFGYPSRSAREGATAEGRQIPGLGDENSDRGSSLWTYDIADPAHPAVTARLRLGEKITESAGGTIGSAAPTGVAAAADAVFVSLAHQDTLVQITPDGKQVLAQTELSPFADSRFHPYRQSCRAREEVTSEGHTGMHQSSKAIQGRE